MTLIKKATKIDLEGKGVLTLRPADYVTQGGEGAIYRKNKLVIKLYSDPRKMRRDDMVGKIRLLAKTFSHQSIVAPNGVVKNSQGSPIGYYMPFVEGEALPRVFTNDFRNQTGFDDAGAKQLSEEMYEVVNTAHQGQALMVDANELNWLMGTSSQGTIIPYVIDVDSWAIGKWPAQVIMPSIRDWQSQQFSPLTDWFAWGVVTFQIFTGIHPFKGKLDGYQNGEMERRMKDNASVFLPEVRLNRAVRDFSCIPGPLLDWYRETFSSQTRSIPPSPGQTGAPKGGPLRVMRTVTTLTGGLHYEKLFELTGDKVLSVWPCGVVRTESGALFLIENQRQIGSSQADRLAVAEVEDGWLLAEETGGNWSFRFISTNRFSQHELDSPTAFSQVVRCENRLFGVTENELVELRLLSFQKPILSAHKRWTIMGNSTKWFHGVGISDVLGSTYLVAPFDRESVAFVKVPELDGVKVIDAKIGWRYVEVVIMDQNGSYQVYGFSFDANWKHYQVTKRDVDQPDLNLAFLPKGVAARIDQDGELTIYVPTQGDQKVLNDKDIATTMLLGNVEDSVVYRQNGALWSLKMR